MANFNQWIGVGYLCRDPELRYTPSGAALCDFAIACNHSWTDQQGQRKEEVTFVDCTAWSKTAENIAQYLKKGSLAMVVGRLKQDTWEDKQTGAKRSKIKVSVERVQFLSGGTAQQAREAAPPPAARPGRTASSPQPDAPDQTGQPDGYEDDVPF